MLPEEVDVEDFYRQVGFDEAEISNLSINEGNDPELSLWEQAADIESAETVPTSATASISTAAPAPEMGNLRDGRLTRKQARARNLTF